MVRAVKSVAGIRVDPEKALVAGTWSSGKKVLCFIAGLRRKAT